MTTRIDFAVDCSGLTDDGLAFVETIAAELVYQAPAMLAALARTLTFERKRRAAGLTDPVWFTMTADTLADAEQAARAALTHAGLCAAFAETQTTPADGDAWVAMAAVFLAIHNGIVAAVGIDDLRAYRLAQLFPNPQPVAVN